MLETAVLNERDIRTLGPLPSGPEPDAYDMAIAYLTENPHDIPKAWDHGGYQPTFSAGGTFKPHPARILFSYAGDRDQLDYCCGCLTMIRDSDVYKSATPELTLAICNDLRIPLSVAEITVESLPIFAGWQRRLDEALDRPAPVWQGPVMAM